MTDRNTKAFYVKRIEKLLERKLTKDERRNSRLTFRNWWHSLKRDKGLK
jgi:hypothetical protein